MSTKGWKCARCSTTNSDSLLECSKCGLFRGSVAVGPPPEPTSGWVLPADAGGARSSGPTPAHLAEGPSGTGPSLLAGVDPILIAPAPSVPLWRRFSPGTTIFVLLIVLGGIGSLFSNAFRSPTGEIVKQGDLTVSDLRPGDCFDIQDPAAETIDAVSAMPCSELHEYQMIFFGEMPPGGTYPTDAVFETYMRDNCLPAFATFIGRDYAGSTLEIDWFTPTTDGWIRGGRSVECVAYDPDQPRLTQSLQGSNR